MEALQAKLQSAVEGKIDFEGQKQVENITRIALAAATVISFLIGFAIQSLTVTFGVFGAAVVVLCLVVVPPWPMFNRHSVKWLPAKKQVENTKAS